jgi:glutaredoxin
LNWLKHLLAAKSPCRGRNGSHIKPILLEEAILRFPECHGGDDFCRVCAKRKLKTLWLNIQGIQEVPSRGQGLLTIPTRPVTSWRLREIQREIRQDHHLLRAARKINRVDGLQAASFILTHISIATSLRGGTGPCASFSADVKIHPYHGFPLLTSASRCGRLTMPNVTLIVSPSCGACPSAKSLWKQLRVKYSFSYREVDITTKDGQELADRHAVRAVPATIIDGKLTFVGVPSRESAEKAIQLKIKQREG